MQLLRLSIILQLTLLSACSSWAPGHSNALRKVASIAAQNCHELASELIHSQDHVETITHQLKGLQQKLTSSKFELPNGIVAQVNSLKIERVPDNDGRFFIITHPKF